MQLNLNNRDYDIIIDYKNNKNMYLRIKDDLKIYITAPYHINEKDIKKFIEKNINSISKILLEKEQKKERLNNKFLYLGKYYDICYIENKKIIFGTDRIFINKNMNIDSFYKKQASIIFKERLNYCYNLFIENIPYPALRIRKMTSKWGVCNVTKKIVTLNLNLIKLDLKYLDYVIIHELAHLIYADHSKSFWQVVSKYCPNYKTLRKEMKDII